MPTGQPDSDPSASDRGDAGEDGRAGERISPWPDVVETTADRIVREAIEAGEFDDLPGTGEPIPGAGTVDDELWWVRAWLRRNRDQSDQESSNSE